jgi:hypothetical protein
MMPIEQYRSHAEDCLRIAETAKKKNGKALWITLARSWLLLAEDAERVNTQFSIVPDQDPETDQVNLANAN